jgi:hypothetical protein
MRLSTVLYAASTVIRNNYAGGFSAFFPSWLPSDEYSGELWLPDAFGALESFYKLILVDYLVMTNTVHRGVDTNTNNAMNIRLNSKLFLSMCFGTRKSCLMKKP